MRRSLLVLAIAAVAIGAVNFFWAFAESSQLGDALNGYVADGHYFVRIHGAYREVGRETWEWSRWHGASVLITHPLAILGMAYLLFRYVFPAFMGTGSTGTERVSTVEASGTRVARARCGGIVGEVSMTTPMLGVSVYPAGVVFSPIFMRGFVVLGSEIRKVSSRRVLFSPRFEIEHSSADAPSPLVLYVSAKSGIALAIEALAEKAGALIAPIPVGQSRADPRRRTFTTIAGVVSVLIGGALVAYGVLLVIPATGAFGFIWTAFSAFIVLTGVRRLIRAR